MYDFNCFVVLSLIIYLISVGPNLLTLLNSTNIVSQASFVALKRDNLVVTCL